MTGIKLRGLVDVEPYRCRTGTGFSKSEFDILEINMKLLSTLLCRLHDIYISTCTALHTSNVHAWDNWPKKWDFTPYLFPSYITLTHFY